MHVRELSNRFDRMVPAASDSIGPLRRQLRRFARDHGASARVQAAVALAFSEACAPVVRSSDRLGDDSAVLIVEAAVVGDELHVRVAHHARTLPVGADMAGHGFGLAIIASLADRFEISSREDGPGMALAMCFRLAP